MRERHSREWWQSTVAQWRSSGQSLEAFAIERDVSPATLRWWCSRLPPVAAEPFAPLALLRVEVAREVVEPATLAVLVGPAELRVIVGTDPAYVGVVVAAIAQAANRC